MNMIIITILVIHTCNNHNNDEYIWPGTPQEQRGDRGGGLPGGPLRGFRPPGYFKLV